MRYAFLAAALLCSTSALAYNENVGGGGADATLWGVKCDGSTNDTASLMAALAAKGSVTVPPFKSCAVSNLVINNQQTLDLQGSFLVPATSATKIVTVKGFKSHLENGGVYDANLATMQTSTLTAGVSSGATVIPVQPADVAKFQVNMIASVQLASGAYWPSKITAVDPVGDTVTIARAIPSTVTGASVNAGGSGYVSTALNGGGFSYLHEGVVLGGIGAPATLTLTASGGAITGVSVDAPGLYQASPGATAAVYDPLLPAAFNGVVNLTYGGANAGAYVDAAFGGLLLDGATSAAVENITVSRAPVGVEVMATTGQTTQVRMDHIEVNGAPIAAFARLVNVNNSKFKDMTLYGYPHHASAFGAAAMFIEADNPTSAPGGNTFEYEALNAENGTLDFAGQLDTFDHSVNDTNRNLGFGCFGCFNNVFKELEGTFSGPSVQPPTSAGGQGVGVYMGSSAVTDVVGMLKTANNATDLHLGDNVSQVSVTGQGWGPSRFFTGSAFSLFIPDQFMTIAALNIGGQSGTLYLAPGVASATQDAASVPAAARGTPAGGFVGASIAPGAVTYTAYFWQKPWNGSSYGAWQALAKCTWTGALTGCSWGVPAGTVGPLDMLDYSLTPSTGAFPSGQIVSAYVGRL